MKTGVTRRRPRSDPASVPAPLRILALAVPLGVAVASIVWRWPDRLLEDSGVALATVQLALGSLLAWGSADAYLRVRRRRLLVIESGGSPATGTEAFVLALGAALSGDRQSVIVVRCADEDISDAVQTVRAACRASGKVSFECDGAATSRVCRSHDAVAALSVARERFSTDVIARGFRDTEVRQFWSVLLRRRDLVMVVRSPHTLDVPTVPSATIDALGVRGLRLVWVGSTHPLPDTDGIGPEFDSDATRHVGGHLRQDPDIAVVSPLRGAAALLDIVGDRTVAEAGITTRLVAATRLVGPGPGPSESTDRAAAALLSDPEFFSSSERQELHDHLQFSSRGIRVLSHLASPVPEHWNPGVLRDADAAGFLAIKRRMCLHPHDVDDRDVAALRGELPRSWLLDIISSLRADSFDRARVLLGLAATPDIVVRWSSAVQLVKTLSLTEPAGFIGLVERDIDAAPPGAHDVDLALGAAGWIAARLRATWPDRCSPLWDRILAEASRRDPSHLALSVARGIMLGATDAPMPTIGMISDFRSRIEGHWLADIKLVHAAALCATAGSAEARALLDGMPISDHDLVRETIRLAQTGVRDGRPPELWTWGLEPLEALATRHRQDNDTLRLLGKVILGYGQSLLGDVPHGSAGHDILAPWTLLRRNRSTHVTRFHNETKRTTLRVGPTFCFRQAAISTDSRQRRAWTRAGRAALDDDRS